MLEQYLLPPKKPFYRRTWFLALLTIALVVMVVGVVVVGLVWAKYTAEASKFDYRKLTEMESATMVYDREGHVMGRFFLENRDPVPIQEMPHRLVQAVVAAEDARFWQHHGVDFYGVIRATIRNKLAGRIKEGASTLTQQLARNTFPDELPAKDKSYSRKLLEMAVAMEIERRLHDKNQIIELYLNRVYFGSGFYGVQAASRGYFGKDVKDLDLSECAMLCGLLRNPNNFSPWANHDVCLDNRNRVLSRMLDLQMITKEECDHVSATDLAIKNRHSIYTQSYALDQVRQQLMKQVGQDSAFSDGFRVYTTIDSNLQRVGEESLARELLEVESRKGYDHETFAQYREALKNGTTKADPAYLQGAVVVLDNRTGGILAMIGGRDFGQSQYNRVTLSARPSGTAFKPFVYAAAFEKGFFPGSLVDDSAMDNRQVMIGGTTGILGEWGPETADNQYEGLIPAREALVKSKNAATVRLGMQAGLDSVIDLAKRAGINEKLSPYPRTFLGSSEVTLMDLTLAYTAFPAGGTRPKEPFLITKIEDENGQVVFSQQPAREPVMDPSIAAEINSCLSDVLETGTGDRAFSEDGLRKFPVAGETGTAYNFTDVWFMGYSSAITCGVWAGFDKPRTPIYRGAFSSQIALPVWVDIMNASFADYQPKAFPVPDNLHNVRICRTSGQLATPECVETIPGPPGSPAITRSTAYYELANDAQMPKVECTVHGANPQPATAAVSTMVPSSSGAAPSQYPRAALAVDLSKVTPVPMQAPTVLAMGDDPFGSVKPMTVLPAVRVDNGQLPTDTSKSPVASASATPQPAASGEPKIIRAERARALDQPADNNTIKIAPPPPLKFE
jgi:penicillin-binding protein 1A